MDNKNSLTFFSGLAKKKPTRKSVKINRFNDCTTIDARFILSFCNKNTELLDLASGTGLVINKIYKKVKHITCVEVYKQFSKFITKNKNVKIVNEDISSYNTKSSFDLVTMFGIVQYFNENEIEFIYKKYYNNLKSDGRLIIKGQFGIKKDVLVAGYSSELNTNYFSEYRKLNSEIKILKKIGYKIESINDIYPKKFNRWHNTHFYAIVLFK